MDKNTLSLADFILGIMVGIATNIFSWWILFHKIVPNVRFSTDISKTPIAPSNDDASGFRYRFKFENSGSRAVIDLEIMARIRIRGLGPYKRTNWQVIQVPLSADGATSRHLPRLKPTRTGKHVRHVLRLFVNAAPDRFDRPVFSELVRRKAIARTLELEDLLTAGAESNLEIEAFGFDEFSGARKLFLSKRYIVTDIKSGPFDQRGLTVRLTPTPAAPTEIPSCAEDED